MKSTPRLSTKHNGGAQVSADASCFPPQVQSRLQTAGQRRRERGPFRLRERNGRECPPVLWKSVSTGRLEPSYAPP